MGFPYDGAGFEPNRVFTIGTSDYSDRVLKWPKISRAANKLKSTNVNISLANTDKEFNNFYTNLYSLPNTCTLSCDSYTLYTGFLSDVQYKNEKCQITLRDRLSGLEVRKIGDSDAVVSFEPQIPSDIAWTLCTCYGVLDDTEGSNNMDIDHISFLLWSETFSVDSVECEANYDGQKITSALESLGKMTNSDIWIDRNGMLKFKAKFDISSNDVYVGDEHITDLTVKVAQDKLINKQYVYGAYNADNNDWSLVRNAIDQTSINSYGLHESVLKDKTIWYQSSVYAGVIAQKRLLQYRNPVREFTVRTPFALINTTVSDRMRIIDDFFGITSAYAWRVVSEKVDMSNGKIEFKLDGAQSFEPFVLDVSNLDGNALLL